MLRDKLKMSSPAQPRLGELFVEAGIIKPQMVTECLTISKRAQMPLGRVLIMSGYVTEPDLDCALESQKLLKQGETTRDAAYKLLRSVHCNKMSIEEAKAHAAFEDTFALPLTEVGKLLQASQVVDGRTLMPLTKESEETNLPVGTLLLRERIISESVLSAALNCLVHIRDNRLSRPEAARIVLTVHQLDCDLSDALQRNNMERLIDIDKLKLLDFLALSGFLADGAQPAILERAIELNEKTGTVLISNGLVSALVLDAALQLQQMLAAKTIKTKRAIELLHLVRDMDTPLASLLEELEGLNEVVGFLRRGRFLNESEIRQIAAHTEDFESSAGSTLIREGVLSHAMLTRAIRCLAYYRNAVLTEQQAFNTFEYCMDADITPEEAIMQIQWDQNNRYGSCELLGKTA
jgi:hypothetical protein